MISSVLPGLMFGVWRGRVLNSSLSAVVPGICHPGDKGAESRSI